MMKHFGMLFLNVCFALSIYEECHITNFLNWVPTPSLAPYLCTLLVSNIFIHGFSQGLQHLLHELGPFWKSPRLLYTVITLEFACSHFCIHVELFGWHRTARQYLVQPVTMQLIGEIILVNQ
jgi:hypothetical protein